ncbi:MAG: IS6 family transposase, partial [Prochloraceae cyanobacterium]
GDLDSDGNTIDFINTGKRFASQPPAVCNRAYPLGIKQLESEKLLEQTTILRRDKYFNNIIDRDRGLIKKRIRPMLNFK